MADACGMGATSPLFFGKFFGFSIVIRFFSAHGHEEAVASVFCGHDAQIHVGGRTPVIGCGDGEEEGVGVYVEVDAVG